MRETVTKLWNKYRELICYLIVGALTTAVSLGVYWLATVKFLDPEDPVELQIANVVSWIAAVTFAYFANRTVVFRSQNGKVAKEAGAFFLSRVGTLLLDMGIMFVAVTLCGMGDKLAKLIVQFVVIAANYLLGKFVVFRKEKSGPAAPREK
ncbi:MAG: GtrA family protein [Clostridia bacterium]|nr:GtrA family protein [Clostridia bacterium]